MSTWQIGESGTEVVLNASGKGELTITLTNTGPAQDRCVLTITPLDGATEAWFDVEEPQRVVPAGQSVAFLCTVTLPQGIPAATYAMQAVAYSADRDPGETSVTSRRVTIVAKESEDTDTGTPWWAFVVTAVVMLSVIGLILWLVFKDDGGFTNTEKPTVAGTAEVQQALTVDPGEWSEEDLTFTLQWQRCDGDGEECADIAGATLPTYPIGADDLARRLRVVVTATTPDDDTASATSDTTDVVGPTQAVPVAVPDVRSIPRSAAFAALSPNFQVIVLTAGEPVDDCDPIVESQNPSEGVVLNAGEQVAISTRPTNPALFCINRAILETGILVQGEFQQEFQEDQMGGG